MAKDRAGNPLRDWMDNEKDSGASTISIQKYLAKEGYLVGQPNLDRHFRDHSPWLNEKKKELNLAKVKSVLARKELLHRNADEELQKLIDLGAERIDSGDMPVDKELFMFALGQKVKNPTVSVQSLVMNFGDALVEGQRERKLAELEVLDESA